ncbi:NADH-quinone oxidoreductase subunit NuoE family protein [Gallicola sp. Sow4_E12]|uniref:NADH-quinone oxidoreductase subunit NuoE family protein n=1 Tax=Gallicola sp. Sow4_E12 TaxID=3438785 RepID=UPI003F90A817
MITTDVKQEKLTQFIKGKKEEDLIEILHFTQDIYNYIPREAAVQIAKELKIPLSKIYGVNTFYSRFNLYPKGKYCISVCMGTACYVKGAESILEKFSQMLGIKVGETTEDLLFSMEDTRCVGECADAPVVIVNNIVYRNVKVSDVPNILADIGEDIHE